MFTNSPRPQLPRYVAEFARIQTPDGCGCHLNSCEFSYENGRHGAVVSVALLIVCVTTAATAGVADSGRKPAAKSSHAEEKTALEEFNSLIGGWRGVGMPRRGSRRGAWIETAEWVWDFSKHGVAIKYIVKKGKQLQSARLTYDPKSKQYSLASVFADKSKRTYTGRLQKEKLSLVSHPDTDGATYRLTVTRLNDKRTLVLHERKPGKTGQFFRIAEVGYTREGTSLAVEGGGEVECVVTGGKGTMRVTHKGKTYYVCCSGCRDAFNEDPEGILAAYRKRVEERKRKAAGK
jgi:YHS domain-containing protein